MRTCTHFILTTCLVAFSCLLSSCNREQIRTLQSPVQAVATLLRTTGGSVEAELVLISTGKAKHEFLTTAQNVELRMPGGDLVRLQQAEPGHYRASSERDGKLTYEAGKTYQFRFSLPASEKKQRRGTKSAKDASEQTYVAVVKTPVKEATFSWAKKPEFAGDTATLEWKPRSLNAIVIVHNPAGQICFSTFDFSDPQFSGDKWARLGSNGRLSLGVDVFSQPGEYRIIKYGVTKNSGFDPEMSADLGMLSGFLAGTCDEVETLTVPK